MRDFIQVWINGERREVRGRDALLSLSDYLRLPLELCGTKIVCSEGDCGACSVLIGRPERQGGRFVYRPVDSCIQFVFQLDGAHVVTVEGLRRDGLLSAVQQALVDEHGSQCGFCTPGFVVSMSGLMEEEDVPRDAAGWRAGLIGNLCRCTGYDSILAAGLKASTVGQPTLDDVYPAEPMLAAMGRSGRDDVITIDAVAACDGVRHLVAAPATLPAALEWLAAHPQATIVAGATDVGVRSNKSHLLPAEILDLNRLAELDGVAQVDDCLLIGSRASWTEVLKACRDALPQAVEVLSRFGGPQIRHVGTIGGNIANASPIADSLPLLFVQEAELELASASGRRRVPIHDFFLGYKQLALGPGELIVAIRLPLPAEGELLHLTKVSRRRDLDIAGFTAAIRLRLDSVSQERIAAAWIALGGVGPTVVRARAAEAFLVGQPVSEESLRQAGEIAAGEIAPISDVRGAADYRRTLARNVVAKFYHQVRGELAVR